MNAQQLLADLRDAYKTAAAKALKKAETDFEKLDEEEITMLFSVIASLEAQAVIFEQLRQKYGNPPR